MRILFHILILALLMADARSQDVTESNRQAVEDEPWVLKPKEPTEDERLREENVRWITEVGSRHWSGNDDMTPEEKSRLWSIFRSREGQEKVSALGTIVVVEEIEKWESDLIEMLYSDEKTYVHTALWVLIGKLKTGSEREIALLTESDAIASQIDALGHLWAGDANIQNRLQKYKADLEEYHLTNESEMMEEPAPPVEEAVEVIEEVTAPESTIEEPAEVVVTESIEEDIEQSSNRWLWLIGAVVVVAGMVFILHHKSNDRGK
jgi:hypothetical protein